MKSSYIRYIVTSLIVFVLYFVTGKYGLDINDVTGHTNIVWIPAGLGLAALLLYGYRMLPAIFLGIVAVSIARNAPLYPSIWIVAASVLEPLLGLYLLRRIRFNNSFDTISDVVKLGLIVAPVISFLSAIPGVLSLALYRSTVTIPVTSLTWWSGHLVGTLIVTPLLLVWSNNAKISFKRPRYFIEMLLLYLSIVVYGVILFSPIFAGPNKSAPTSYLVFLPVLWAIFRFDLRTIITTMSAVSFLLVASVIFQTGPFTFPSMYESSLSLKSFLTIFSITSLLTGVALNERKKYEERKDNFISIASHELKTPLTTIKVVTQLLQKMQHKDTKQEKYLDNMSQQINKMVRLIGDMLDLSKIQAGKLQLQQEKFLLGSVVQQVVENMQTINPQHKIILKGKFVDSVEGDKDRIGQVVMNLLSNAVKYSSERGKIIVSLASDRKNVMVSVQDFGAGIPKNRLGKIFERFYRVNEEQHRNIGFGLGLFISAEIVRQHKGKIWVQSIEGKGSTFYFTLPLN